jgi:PiT family inorganic phosphate transporter
VLGAGATQRLSAVRWGVAGNILLAWVMTIPCAALVGAGMEEIGTLPGGAVLVFAFMVAIASAAFIGRSGQGLRLRAGPAQA